MRKTVAALLFLLAVLGMQARAVAGQNAFDFGEMPPLPPPLVDDAPAPPPLTPPGQSASSLLSSPLSPPPASAVVPPAPPPASTATQSASTSPLAPPPLAPPPIVPAADGGVAPVNLPDGVPAPAAPVPITAGPSLPETPRPAKITGGRVNVRAGPNTQYESIAVLTTGAPVTVLARNGDWYKIVFPADQLASIHKNYVNADITGEIPEAGLPGVVNSDNADVHAFYWDKSTVVGKLNKGDPVTIRQERGQWYRINAPESARAYVFAEYVRVDGNEQVAADTAPPPENPAVDITMDKQDATGRLKLSENDRRAAEIKENYFRRLQEQQAQAEEQAAQQVNRLEEALDDLEARLKQVDEEYGSRISYPVAITSLGSAAWAPPDPLYGGFTGWVENIGRVGGAPASFRLTKGGEIRFYLRSDRFSLNDFVGRRVWVNGNVELASGASASVLNVDQIRILSEQEIAEGMRQYESSASRVQVYDSYGQPASDPYASYGVGDEPAARNYESAPVIPADPSHLPDVVGSGATYYPSGSIIGSSGEVDSDFYENPIVSEIGP